MSSPEDEAPKTKKKKPNKRAARGFPRWMPIVLGVGAMAAIVLGLGRFLLFVPVRQPSGSMFPTVGVGEWLSVNRLDTTPTRGAVVVFRYPEHKDQLFDKRVVGLPGDVVRTSGRKVTLNGWEIPSCALGKYVFQTDEGPREGELEVEFLGEAAYLVFHDATGLLSEEGGPWTVKEGEYFVLGDNRENSHDSRMWFGGAGGGVPFGDTYGRVRGFDAVKLPSGAEGLEPALRACLAKRPDKTSPPPP